MGYPPPPPPPGAPGTPGGYGPPPGAPYGAPPPQAPPPGGYGGGYGGPPPPGGGYAPPAPPGGGSGGGGGGKSNTPLIVLMGALVVVVLLAVVGGLILLGRDGGGDVELTEAQLQDALLTEGDVGDGYTLDPAAEEDDDSDDFERDEIDASDECIDLYERFEATEAGSAPTVEASAKFDGDDNSQVEHSLEQGSEFGLADVRDLAESCPEISVDDGESVGTLRFEVVDDLTDVGDDRITLRIEVELTAPIEIDIATLGVIWERDGTVASLNITGAIDEETFEAADPDQDKLRTLVERADEKLEEVIADA